MAHDPRKMASLLQPAPPPPPPAPPVPPLVLPLDSQSHLLSQPATTITTTTATTKSILFSSEDAMDEDEDMDMPPLPPASSLANGGSTGMAALDGSFPATEILISRIITPSPYPQHNAGPTSSRFRNALHRVTTKPTSDVEAWQALMTEVNSCYRNIPSVHAVDADTHAKLDWVESCYGALLKHFPYAASYYATIAEMLLSQSARVGEEHGPLLDNGISTSKRSMRCEAKVLYIFQKTLGFNLDGSIIQDTIGGMCVWCVELWLLYIRKAVRDATRAAAALYGEDRAQHIRDATKKAFETAIAQAGASPNNHLLWKNYLNFVRSWILDPVSSTDHALAQQQMIQLRSVYQRLVTHPITGLDQFWQEYELFERGQNEALAQVLITEFSPKYQHARTVYLERNRVYGAVDLELNRLGTDPSEESEEDYASKMNEEFNLLKLWKMRCSYERTNPEHLTSGELAQRIRHAYKQMVCVFTRHPESWHMWSMWELHGIESKRPEVAIAVLQQGQEHIPDCTLLAYAEAQIVELKNEDSSACITVMEKFLERSPNSLGFVLCQQLTRRYRGAEAARKVFSQARRILVDVQSTKLTNETTTDAEAADANKADTTGAGAQETDDKKISGVVTNRLDPSVGVTDGTTVASKALENDGASVSDNKDELSNHKKVVGAVTWHLYASHAMMEHRLNRLPEVAARIYELGLRKHALFLTKPQYVHRYAQLLLELDDPTNLRALMTRAVAACEAQDKKASLGPLWDMSLRFESVLSADPKTSARLLDIERKRREAVLGADMEDVATGGITGLGDQVLIGAQKSSISEHLTRSEGYDISSNIINGIGRTVELLDIMGLWGSDAAQRSSNVHLRVENDDEISGGKSDALLQKRLRYGRDEGMPLDAATGELGAIAGAKVLTARERLQQGAATSAVGPGQASAMMLSIQQSPEWIRSLLLLLPASRLRLPIVAKPPPHLTELALSTLQRSILPPERPADVINGLNKRKIVGTGNDSSDDEDDGKWAGGYGTQFRSRQRARMNTDQNGTLS